MDLCLGNIGSSVPQDFQLSRQGINTFLETKIQSIKKEEGGKSGSGEGKETEEKRNECGCGGPRGLLLWRLSCSVISHRGANEVKRRHEAAPCTHFFDKVQRMLTKTASNMRQSEEPGVTKWQT